MAVMRQVVGEAERRTERSTACRRRSPGRWQQASKISCQTRSGDGDTLGWNNCGHYTGGGRDGIRTNYPT